MSSEWFVWDLSSEKEAHKTLLISSPKHFSLCHSCRKQHVTLSLGLGFVKGSQIGPCHLEPLMTSYAMFKEIKAKLKYISR